MNEEEEAIDFDKILNNAIGEIQEGQITHHLKQRLRVSCPRCKERFSLEKKIVQKIENELLTEVRGKWLKEFTEVLTAIKKGYETEHQQKVEEIQSEYDAKLLHGIEQDTKDKFEHLMSEFLKRKIDLYRKGLEAVAKQLKELAGKVDAMDEVPNPFEGDELFQEGDSSTV